jgi:hypothetical protein
MHIVCFLTSRDQFEIIQTLLVVARAFPALAGGNEVFRYFSPMAHTGPLHLHLMLLLHAYGDCFVAKELEHLLATVAQLV